MSQLERGIVQLRIVRENSPIRKPDPENLGEVEFQVLLVRRRKSNRVVMFQHNLYILNKK